MRILNGAVAAVISAGVIMVTVPTPQFQLAGSASVKTQLSTSPPPPPPGTPASTHHGSSVVCSQHGLGSGLSVSVSGGSLHISYHGTAAGSGKAAILAAWNAYKSCVTTSPTVASIQCSSIHDAGHFATSCSVNLGIKPTKWTTSTPATPPGGVSILSAQSQCLAELHNPSVAVAHPQIASMSYYPAHTWLLNLPVEYSFKTSPAPAPKLIGQTSASCSTTPLYHSYKIAHQGGQKRIYAIVSQSATGSVHLQINGLTVTSVTPGPASVSMALASSPTQTIATEQVCPVHSALVAPAQLPNFQGNLTAYTAYFAAHQICTITPSGVAFENAAVSKQPVIFNLRQEWIFHASYRITGSITTDYAGTTTAYYASGATRVVSTYSTPSTTPYSGPTHNTTLVAQATEFHSPPIAVEYVVGVECSVVRGTVSCPQTGSAG